VTQSEPNYTKCEMARARACHRHAEAGLELRGSRAHDGAVRAQRKGEVAPNDQTATEIRRRRQRWAPGKANAISAMHATPRCT